MSIINTGSFPKLLRPGLHKVFMDNYKTWDNAAQWKQMFEVNASKLRYEEETGISGFTLAPVKNEGGVVYMDSAQQTYTARYSHVVYALGFEVTEEEIEDNIYMDVGKKFSKALAFSHYLTKEIVGANIFNNGFSSSAIYAGGDGKPLFANDHPTMAGSQSNSPSTPASLSEKALEDASIQIMNTRNERGLNINVMPQKLIVSRDQYFEAIRILRNPERPGTADRDINALYNAGVFPGGLHINHYLTDANAFFIITTCQDGFKYFERRGLNFRSDNDENTYNAKFSANERYSFGWSDWRQGWGSPGAS